MAADAGPYPPAIRLGVLLGFALPPEAPQAPLLLSLLRRFVSPPPLLAQDFVARFFHPFSLPILERLELLGPGDHLQKCLEARPRPLHPVILYVPFAGGQAPCCVKGLDLGNCGIEVVEARECYSRFVVNVLPPSSDVRVENGGGAAAIRLRDHARGPVVHVGDEHVTALLHEVQEVPPWGEGHVEEKPFIHVRLELRGITFPLRPAGQQDRVVLVH
mmetsp:Transcript_65955/g.208775  ORF Transcript_65955/g.208775 Transcript_65955/m.208775 type:complete len:217 (-) Transcript_65955:360-1010(-)